MNSIGFQGASDGGWASATGWPSTRTPLPASTISTYAPRGGRGSTLRSLRPNPMNGAPGGSPTRASAAFPGIASAAGRPRSSPESAKFRLHGKPVKADPGSLGT